MIALYLSLIDDDLQKNKFEKVYYRYRKLMFHIAYGVLGNVGDSEDIVQEAFLRISKNIDKIGEVDSSETKNFIAIITKREAMKIYNKKKKRNEIFESEMDQELNDSEGNNFFDRVSNDNSGNVINEVEQALNALPYKYSSIMTLKYVMGYSGKEIAQIIGSSETNVRQQLFLGRKMLEKMLGEDSNEN